MAEQVGTLLWELRTAAGWSLGQLSRQAGVSKSALSQWESGLRLPRLPELEATLAALGATPAQTARVIASIEAPRAVRRLSTPSAKSPIGPLPAAHDLLRAMRLRRNWTQEQVARRVGVGQNTVARWERGERLPSTEQLQTLCFALEAHEEELVALTTGRFQEAPDEITVEPQAILDAVHILLFTPRQELVDLRFLTLERALWRQAAADERVMPLLATAYAEHAHYLSLYDRWDETRAMAERALALTPPQTSTPNHVLRAILKLAAAEVYGGHRLAPERGVCRIRSWLSSSPEPDYRAWMLSDVGKYMALAGQPQYALPLGQQAIETARLEQRMRVLDHCRLLLAAGHPEKAMYHLPVIHEDEPVFIYEAFVRCEAHLALGESPVASKWLQRAYAVIEEQGMAYNRAEADALASRF